jgi:hypothetical protein
VSFGNEAIFPFPAVQYIPLAIATLEQGDINPSKANLQSSQKLIIGNDILVWRNHTRQEYQIELPEQFSDESLAVLVFGAVVDAVKYRSYFVTMTGREKPGYYQLFTLPRRYFYKNNLCFELFDATTGKRLGRQNVTLP